MSLLELHAVRKLYGSVAALDGIDLQIPAGSRTAVVGPSGSGKTTLLRLIAGYDAPDSGRLILDGQVLADGPALVPAHLRGIGVVPQDGALFPHISIADNIGFGLARSEPNRTGIIADLMTMVGLDTAMLTRRPDALSGGQQQRVALARALARKPRLMLLDEPFSALDTGLRASTRKAVSDLLSAAGITTILVTHDQAEALSFADQVAVMRAGRLEQIGPPRELYLRPKDAMIAEFLGEAILLPAIAVDGWADSPLGRIALDDKDRTGSVAIMLRPEQLSLNQTSTVGTVSEVDFGGAVCSVTVRLDSGEAIVLRLSCLDAPAVGTRVGLSVSGTAHLFA